MGSSFSTRSDTSELPKPREATSPGIAMGDNRGYQGALVAFEGPTDVLSTQLRLLPTSPQISILPPIENYMGDLDESEPFDAKTFIRRMHDAALTRHQDALNFLKDSTPAQKRLVFMNGGTPGAYAACIRAIAEHETDGDMAMAQRKFEGLVRHGLAGLERDYHDGTPLVSPRSSQLMEEDPTVRAMRAADALDRLTANLQPNPDMGMTGRTRPRSMSLPMYSFDDRFGDAAPFYVFGTQSGVAVEDSDDETFSTPIASRAPSVEVPDHEEPRRRHQNHYLSSRECTFYAPTSPSCAGESYGPPTPHTNLVVDLLSPRSDVSFASHPAEPVVFGRASVVQVRPSGRKRSLKRTRSLDRMVSYSTQYRDTILRMRTRSSAHDHEQLIDKRRHSCMDSTSHKGSLASKRASYAEPTRTIYVRTEQPIIALSPAPLKPRRKVSAYVDRGTDAAGMPPFLAFQQVLPLTEDLVINFRDGPVDRFLDYLVQSFRTGVYPLKPGSTGSETSELDDEVSVPRTPSFDTSATAVQVHLVNSRTGEPEDYDPFAYEPTLSKTAATVPMAQAITRPAPPTPAQTPPPPESVWYASEDKFHDCNVTDCKTAVAVQNDLRNVLNIYFPSEDKGYHQFHFSLLPEMGGMWKPIFSHADQDGHENSGRRIDQILAVGAERGVQRAQVSGITAQLEKLGTKAGEISRSGRLDFRYLVANAMQTFTAQPLAYQTRVNPFTNSYLLATLIIPHLETFFVTNPDVRFLLLDYPPDHLPTVLALQKLVGVDLMKVAQVVDSNAKEPLPFIHIRGPSLSRTSSEESTSTKFKTPSSTPPPPQQHRSEESVSISKANFLLTSAATDAEITKFITTIRKLLIEVSFFYVTDEPPRRTRSTKRTPAPITGTFSAFPRASMVPQSPPLSPPSPRFSAASLSSRSLAPRPPSPASSVQTPPSLSDTAKPAPSGRSRRGRKPDAADEDDDSDFDNEDRRLMPLFDEQARPRKGNSHKALKFLGLA